MIQYRIDKETPDYITMDRHSLLSIIASEKEDWSNEELRQEASRMLHQMTRFEYEEKEKLYEINRRYIDKFKIRKDSALGKYLIENVEQNEIEDYTNYISYENICEAYLISSFQNDAKLTNKILTLFQNQCSGSKEELLKEFPFYEAALDFILENNDFEKYLAKVNQEEIEEEEAKQEPFIVYEDGVWAIKNPQVELVRVPKKETI